MTGSTDDYARWLDRLGREAKPARGGDGEPSTFVQWKGTDLCLDFTCACGFEGHVDGDHCYVLQCSACGRKYEVGDWLSLRPMTSDDERDGAPVVVYADPDEQQAATVRRQVEELP